MISQNIEQRITQTCLDRFGKNLAAVLIFGSYNTGEFVPGKSDVDLIILFKKDDEMKLQRELDVLKHIEFADIPASIVHFRTLDDYKKHIYSEGTWSSWITVICGSKPVYSTKEFEDFKKHLSENPIPNKTLAEYLQHKDDIELDGYFRGNSGWNLTKAYYSHFRRKLQILSWLDGNNLTFDYRASLGNIQDLTEKSALQELVEMYEEREEITSGQAAQYYRLAKDLTKQITARLK